MKNDTGKKNSALVGLVVQTVILAVLVGVLAFLIYAQANLGAVSGGDVAETPQQTVETPDGSAGATPEPTPTPTPTPTPFEPYSTDETDPSNGINATAIMVGGEIVDSYEADAGSTISFGEGSEYTSVVGITTFRGNNFRDGASYGVADLTDKKFGSYWTVGTASLQAPDGEVWTGCGWTGQPLIVEWPQETRKNMNMYEWAREADELTEVICPTMDGYIYFMELASGQYTREPLYIGYTFKGTGSLDPRGYPILYVGSGYTSSLGDSRVFVINLIDGSIMYTFGNNDSFALRAWPMFDGAPLVDAETDQLIYPGENGVVYIIKLNSDYNESAGTVSIEPEEPVKWRYNTTRTTISSYWLGFETSPVIWQGHMIIADNSGHLMCLDLNSLTLKWVQDVEDDTNSTPVLELEDGRPYIYISTSFHGGWRAAVNATADVPIWKIDAVTGEIVWSTSYVCHTVSGISGGVQGTVAVGKNSLSDLVFVSVARTPDGSTGLLVALDKKTGQEVWNLSTQMYSWSSPVDFYDSDGNGYIIYCTTGHYIYLLDGRTGEKLDAMNLGGLIEASPAVFNNYVVVGTRADSIYGIELK